MLDPKVIDEISSKVTANLPKGLQALQSDLQHNLRSTLGAALGKLNLVTREEFEIQQAVLARTRAKVDVLERRVVELEKALENRNNSA
ncbi:MAG TPA: accessory factor UbiK family protein [Thiolapillus brandeum]|uniref:Ubiquinone biosynthesis accessory factor UbiK n=1 Tax=Thiolapillus brandeum TaxID=1076588 RepID=A0A7C5J053_9GAMM|nr:accessory factor UbiK family protein [Thiolapillus brandeum]